MFVPVNTIGRTKPTGWFAIGIENVKNDVNIGTLWRSAYLMGASYIFTIGTRYKLQSSDTHKAFKSIPLHQYDCFDTFKETAPKDAKLVGIEIDDKAQSLVTYEHFQRTIYILGAEDHGLTTRAKEICHDIVYIPSVGCLNVAATGSIVLYDRIAKQELQRNLI